MEDHGGAHGRGGRGGPGPVRRGGTLLLAVALLIPAAQGTALAHGAGWTGGVPLHDLVPAVIVASGIAAALGSLVVAHRRGRTRLLAWMSDLAEDISETPGWVALPAFVAAIGLIVACAGFYWDVATHMDRGRDIGPFANPSHYPILAGLVLLVVAGVFSVALGREDDHPTGVRLTSGWHAPLGGLLLSLCGVAAVFGFPLDDLWHRIFGQDVTLWGPTHVLMVAGASLTTLALWVLYTEIQYSDRMQRSNPRMQLLFVRLPEIAIAGAFLIGLSTLQAEFDYGFPQFRLVLQPVLIMLAAGVGLVTARIRLGRGGALMAVAFYIVLRGYLTLGIDYSLGHLTLHMPLYLAEAALVELVALFVPRRRQLTLGLWSGLAIGTLGLAAEWAWSHVWMPTPWTSALLPEAVVLGLPAALAGGAIGGLLGRALTPREIPRQPIPAGRILAGATVVAILVIAIPLPRGGMTDVIGREVTGEVVLEEVDPTPNRRVHATVRVDPPSAVEDAEWFMVTAWQGSTTDDTRSVLSHLEPDGSGRWRTTEPVPVYGEWKVMVRIHRDSAMVSLPIHIPEDPVIDVEGIPARDRMVRPFIADTTLLALAAEEVPAWVSRVAYTTLGLIAAAWVAAYVWGLAHLIRRTRELDAPTRRAATGRDGDAPPPDDGGREARAGVLSGDPRS